MAEKRYSIVRVDDTCPSGHDGCKVNLVCVQDRKRIKVTERNCKNCLYGDTKEQLIRKVAQVIKRITNDGYVIAYNKKFGTGYINTVLENTEVAEEIVEFLGVE